ncbi:MAG: hypothetical protein LBD93_07905, partial [Treponema sp.]|nr:hypothetical protein [Treponema sp.]
MPARIKQHIARFTPPQQICSNYPPIGPVFRGWSRFSGPALLVLALMAASLFAACSLGAGSEDASPTVTAVTVRPYTADVAR